VLLVISWDVTRFLLLKKSGFMKVRMEKIGYVEVSILDVSEFINPCTIQIFGAKR
jgi:hypothetical protein